jgi:hypothetical protein
VLNKSGKPANFLGSERKILQCLDPYVCTGRVLSDEAAVEARVDIGYINENKAKIPIKDGKRGITW